MPRLTDDEIAAADLAGWTYADDALRTEVRTKDFAEALALTNAVGEAAEAANHHPDLELGWGRLGVTLTSHDAGGVTDRDVRMARMISGLVRDAGLALGGS